MRCGPQSLCSHLKPWQAALVCGCRFSRDAVLETITTSELSVSGNIVTTFGVTQNKEALMVVGLKSEQFDPDEPDVEEPFW